MFFLTDFIFPKNSYARQFTDTINALTVLINHVPVNENGYKSVDIMDFAIFKNLDVNFVIYVIIMDANFFSISTKPCIVLDTHSNNIYYSRDEKD